ncbi:MAG TPA: amylo-alpha-1,6-glucosidase, partial [Tepidisphaeraceae bacterium]|nr:amylo-alpha-1,6-glucosidase [Tepidisphaeraceae bacterium]
MSSPDLSTLDFADLLAREWLATFGNGSFACSTVCGLNTRKYHGLLVAAMTPPVRRMVLLSRVEETVHSAGQSYDLASNEYPGVIFPQGYRFLRAFNADPFPRWAYQHDGWTVEKQLRPLPGTNTVVLSYTLLAGTKSVDFELRPLFALRGMHELMYQWNVRLDAQNLAPRHHRLPATSRSPEVFFAHDGDFSSQACWYLNTIYRREQERGYAGLEDLWMPGVLRWTLSPGQTVHFVCSTDPIDFSKVIADADRHFETAALPQMLLRDSDPALASLHSAAQQFIVQTREQSPAVITGYPWSAPSTRDAMICLPGLFLTTGRLDQARDLLRSLASTLYDGLMPSELAEDGSGYRYTAADTSLWFIYAVGEYLRHRGDESFLRDLLPVLNRIIEAYGGGTHLGIAVDNEGLLQTRQPGTPTTWMDAKIDDWVVTPRQGRPVSLNALWYNALCTVAELSRKAGQPQRAEDLLLRAQRTQEAFNRRFWNASAGCCFDVVEDRGSDPAIRPNQIFALSLPYPVLDSSRHAQVIEKICSQLLTPVGLRTLAPTEPAYQGTYAGSPVSRDRAYHQGSAFPWLLGSLVTAYVRLHGRTDVARLEARKMLQGCFDYLQEHSQL